MTESALSDEADPLYRPLGGLEAWAAVQVDTEAWTAAANRLRALTEEAADRAGMVARGARLAAAYRSAALDGLFRADPAVTLALLRGEASLADVAEPERAHVRANHAALALAATSDVTEEAIRRIHEVACRPQLTHRVRVDDRVQDHVMAPGDYKHHPNHVPLPKGGWRPTVPVAQIGPEMARLVGTATSRAFTALHPAVRAAWLHHAVLHVQPFADGNGRVTRALAGGCLLRETSLPLVDPVEAEDPAAAVALVERAFARLVDLAVSTAPEHGALDRWRHESNVARALRAALVPGLEQALDRPQTGSRWHADLSAATVVAGETIVARVPLDGRGRTVEEVLEIDAHPLDGGPVTVTAREARLPLEAGGDLEAWLDRVVSVLALRVAAELEDG